MAVIDFIKISQAESTWTALCQYLPGEVDVLINYSGWMVA